MNEEQRERLIDGYYCIRDTFSEIKRHENPDVRATAKELRDMLLHLHRIIDMEMRKAG